MSKDVEKYTELLRKQRGLTVGDIVIREFYPQPTEQDYLRGFIVRYFAYNRVSDIYYEVDRTTYDELKVKDSIGELSIDVFQIQWRISGNLQSTIDKSTGLSIIGVTEHNESEINRIREQEFKTFGKKLPGVLQFYRE